MNLEDLMKAAQNVQDQLGKAQANLDSVEVEGVAGGGLVTVKATAKGRVTGIAIDDSLMELSEKQMLEDLSDGVDAVSGAEMSKMTAGLPLPPGFKLPF